jgi:hypothetical protein
VIRNTLFLFVGSGENEKKEIKLIEASQYLVNPNEALNLLYLPRNCLKYNSGIKCDVLPYLNRKLRRKYVFFYKYCEYNYAIRTTEKSQRFNA